MSSPDELRETLTASGDPYLVNASEVLEPRRECLHVMSARDGDATVCGAHVLATNDPNVVYCSVCGRYSRLTDTIPIE